MALRHPWWKKWICYLSCEWFTKPVLGKRFCVCAYDAIGYRKKVKREQGGKDGGLRFLQLPKTISFIGLDGSGKTTQSKKLEAFLKKNLIPYSYVHLPTAHPLNWLPKRTKKSCKQDDCGCKDSKPGFLICMVRQKFFIFGMMWIYLTRMIPNWMIGRIVVCDRWFFDELIHLRYRRMSYFTKVFEKITPTAGMTFYLQEDAKKAFERAKEANLEYYTTKKTMYDTLSKRKKTIIVPVSTKDKTWKAIEEKLYARFGHVLWEKKD